MGQRTLHGELDHRAIGHRVGERNTQLNDVGTGSNQVMHQRQGYRRGRITGSNVRDQRLAASGLQGGKTGLNSAHG